MKNVITIIACILILAIFMVQIVANVTTHTKILAAETEITAAVQTAKQDGCFTTENINNLKAKLAEKLKCEESEITVDIDKTTTTPVYRGELVEYSITYPVKGVVGAAGVLGISNNTAIRTMSGASASEYVGN